MPDAEEEAVLADALEAGQWGILVVVQEAIQCPVQSGVPPPVEGISVYSEDRETSIEAADLEEAPVFVEIEDLEEARLFVAIEPIDPVLVFEAIVACEEVRLLHAAAA